MPLQIRRGTNAERLEETFALGELIYVTDEQKLVVGDGATQGGIVVSTDVDTETVQNITANMFTEGNHANIAFAYDTTAGTINATVDLSELDILDFEGVFRADGFQGSIFLDDSSLFLDAEFNTVFFDNVRTVGSIIPEENLSYSIGNEDFRFSSVYTSELFLDDALITSFDGSVDLPFGSTIDGGEILIENGIYNISIVSEDSTILVNSTLNILSNGTITIQGSTISTDVGPELTFDNLDTNNYKFILKAASPDEELGLAPFSILSAIDHMTSLDIMTQPFNDGYNTGDISGVLTFSFDPELDSERLLTGALIGAQLDPNFFSENYAASKFFIAVFPGEDFDDLPIEDVDLKYLTFDPAGRLGVDLESAQATVDINGFMKLKVLEEEPVVPELESPNDIPDGIVAIADGVNWDPLTNGKQSMVVRLGGEWVEIASAAGS